MTPEPFVVGLIVLTICVAFMAIRTNTQCATALMTSLVAAQLFTPGGYSHLYAHVLFLCSMICLIRIKDYKIGLLDVEGHEVNYAISFLYLLRLGLFIIVSLGLLTYGLMWYFSIGLLIVQILLLAGEVTYGKRLNSYLAGYRVRLNRLSVGE